MIHVFVALAALFYVWWMMQQHGFSIEHMLLFQVVYGVTIFASGSVGGGLIYVGVVGLLILSRLLHAPPNKSS